MWVLTTKLLGLFSHISHEEERWNEWHKLQHCIEASALEHRVNGLEAMADLEPAKSLFLNSIIKTQKAIRVDVAKLWARIPPERIQNPLRKEARD